MKNSLLIVLGVIFLILLGLKWGHDSMVKRRAAEAKCYSQMALAIEDLRMSNKNTLIYLCGELWGKEHWEGARKTDILTRRAHVCQRQLSNMDRLIALLNPQELAKAKYEAYAKCMGWDISKTVPEQEVAEPGN
jgi:hypothetical protein